MKAEIKQKWIAALRGGEYKQTTGKLRCEDSFCCLGVLCDLFGKECDMGWSNMAGRYTFFGKEKTLMPQVMEWSGIHSRVASYSGGTLTYANDNIGKTFDEIADIIEKHF